MVLICTTFGEVMTTIGYVAIALLGLMFMVIVHEFGHYLAGKKLGFKINEFAIGFGPRIFKHTNKKTGEIFSIRPIPLGGFCQFEGEDEDNASPKAFNNQKPWKRLIVLAAGAIFNLISAFILITLVFTFYGQLLPTVADIYDEAYIATAENSIKKGDVILNVDGKQVNILMADDISTYMSGISDEGKVTVLRDGKKIEVTVRKSDIYLRDAEGNIVYSDEEKTVISTKYAFGFTSYVGPVKLNFFRALGRSFSYGFYVIFKIIWLLGQLILGKLNFFESAGGPVTIISTMTEASRSGFSSLLYIMCILSANIAVMNLLPLPALDGGRIVFTIIEWIRKKPINRKVEGIIHFAGLVLFFGIAILADLIRYI